MKLHDAPGACSLAPHILLEEAGARFERERVDLAANQQNGAEHLRVNRLLSRSTSHASPHWTAHARRLAERPAVQRACANEGVGLGV